MNKACYGSRERGQEYGFFGNLRRENPSDIPEGSMINDFRSELFK